MKNALVLSVLLLLGALMESRAITIVNVSTADCDPFSMHVVQEFSWGTDYVMDGASTGPFTGGKWLASMSIVFHTYYTPEFLECVIYVQFNPAWDGLIISQHFSDQYIGLYHYSDDYVALYGASPHHTRDYTFAGYNGVLDNNGVAWNLTGSLHMDYTINYDGSGWATMDWNAARTTLAAGVPEPGNTALLLAGATLGLFAGHRFKPKVRAVIQTGRFSNWGAQILSDR